MAMVVKVIIEDLFSLKGYGKVQKWMGWEVGLRERGFKMGEITFLQKKLSFQVLGAHLTLRGVCTTSFISITKCLASGLAICRQLINVTVLSSSSPNFVIIHRAIPRQRRLSAALPILSW